MDLTLDQETGPLVQRIAAALNRRIDNGALGAGEKLPSVRRLAQRLAVSPFTVVAAYDRLVAEGRLVARSKSGFFVARQAGTPVPPLTLDPLPSQKSGLNPIWMMRQSLTAGPGELTPGCGWLPADWLPDAAIRAALRAVARQEGSPRDLAEYGVPLGFRPLREVLARRLNEIEIPAEPDRLLLTDSASQAIDLVCRYLVAPDDHVLVDDPGYFNFHAAVRAQRGRCLPVPMTPQGPDLDALDKLAARHRPKLYLTNAGLQNPTGVRMGQSTAHRLLGLAQRHGFRILEDDIFRDFEARPGMRLAALDGLSHVIHLGSFSKTLSAATRIGFLAADHATLADLADLKLAVSFGNNELSARVIHRLLSDGSYRKHATSLRDRLARARFQVLKRLTGLGLLPWLQPNTDPGEGLFLWMALPDGRKAVDVTETVRARGVILAPGNVFSADTKANGPWHRYLRFNVAQSLDPRIAAVLKESLR
jgi:DNA-binding transcriptional MocR family regulator